MGAGKLVFDGKAGKRVTFLLRRNRDAYKWYEPDLAYARLTEVQEPREPESYVVLWEKIDPDATYALGVDVVEGVEGGDFAVIKGINRRTKNVAISYFSRIDEVQLCKVIAGCSKLLTTHEAPWIGIETIGPGLSTFDICAENFGEEIPNLFMMPSFDQVSQKVSLKKGWRTNAVSRNVLIKGVREWLLMGESWADQRLLREITTFVRHKTGKAAAKEGANDDEVIAFGIALQVDVLSDSPELPAERRLLAQGVDEGMFEGSWKKIDEPTTIEERCLAAALSMVAERQMAEQEAFEDGIDLLYGGN